MNRDIDLQEWLNGTRHHPPAGEDTILAHQAARNLVAKLGTSMFQLVPPGRDKSLLFTALEDVLMRANRAIAISGGPNGGHVTDDLRRVADMDGWINPISIEQESAPPLPLFDPEEVRLHKGERPPTRTATLGDAFGFVTTEIKAEQVAPGEGYVQMGVVSQTEAQAQQAAAEPGPNGFKGFWATITTAEQLSALLVELAAAGTHVWGQAAMDQAVG